MLNDVLEIAMIASSQSVKLQLQHMTKVAEASVV